MFFADWGLGSSINVDALTFDDQGNVDSILDFADETGITQIALGPDSYLYFSNLVTGEIGRWIIDQPLSGSATNGDDLIPGTEEDDFIDGRSGDDHLIGKEGDDTIRGHDGDDNIRGNEGDDWLFGNEGNDRLLGLQGNDTLIGGNNQDTLRGANGDDLLIGNQGVDSLHGGSGDDTVFAGMGDDTLIAGRGDDLLIGGAGKDQFILNSTAGRNVIKDFEPGTDLLKVPDSISWENINIVSGINNTATFITDELERPIVVLREVAPDSLNINRDFIW